MESHRIAHISENEKQKDQKLKNNRQVKKPDLIPVKKKIKKNNTSTRFIPHDVGKYHK